MFIKISVDDYYVLALQAANVGIIVLVIIIITINKYDIR